MILGFVLLASLTMTAQYYSITYVSVSSEDIAEFERKETTYWSKVKKAAIDRGEQNLWLLARKVGTAGNNDVNYAFVNGYPTLEAMTSTSWNPESLGFNVQDAMSPYTVYEIHNYKILDQIPGQGGKYSVWNYARPKNMKGFVSENQDLWKPMMEKTIKEDKTGAYVEQLTSKDISQSGSGIPIAIKDNINVKKPLPKKYSLISLEFIVLCLETSIKPHIIHIGIIDNKLKLIKRK